MQRFWSEKARTMQPYVAGEQPRDGILIKLNTNENAYPTSPQVQSAVAMAADRLRLYPPADSLAFREAVARFYDMPLEWTFAGNGSDEVLALAFRAYLDEGTPVAWPGVTYSFYPVYAQLFGLSAAPLPMLPGLAVDVAALLRHDGPIVLANPNAPTGIALPVDTIAELAASAESKGFPLILDEAYAAFADDSAARLLADHPNLLLVGTLSKSHALAGMRLGYALGNPALIEALWRIKDSFNSYPLDHLAIAAGAAALDDRAYFEHTREAILHTRMAFVAVLDALGFTTLPSSANFVFTKKPDVSGEVLFTELRRRGILVRRFALPDIADYLRITIGRDDQMAKLTDALEDILNNLPK